MRALKKTTALLAIAGMLSTSLAMAQEDIVTVDGSQATVTSAAQQLATSMGMSVTGLIATGALVVVAGAVVVNSDGGSASGT